ncbi:MULTISPECIES: UvrD-helicase domain-containing protein [Rhodococcus]|uniref:UvrD-helicase domain-containing protein n=1 Tax=Rhodococcus TaxID=1827 RepID=UPI001356FE7B|nr:MULTISPECIES: UvrD-helicase domain-containing protein [Rhodococcus]KAF0956757.1 ATP-dependent helicase/nuclease subunit A [Rhodococcus sp. T7]KAF0966585.1 ATP-dependent helicase/nuclease subunit A [Rhodococcus sp. T7]UOT08347.1 UvrD-helicase domain-containing protein [Rhodococcus opacus]
MTAAEERLVDQPQRDRIEYETASSLFVEAGAGSGKTHSLVSRICHLVLHDGVELDRIAAITFTEKAAAELRERVRARLSDSDESDRRNAALGQVDTAAIGTLHAFAARIVGEHPLEAGVPPRIRVVDAKGSQLAFERRWQRMRSELFPDDADSEIGQAMTVIVTAGASLDQVRDLADRLDRHWDRLTAPEQVPGMPAPELDAVLRQADLLLDCLDDCTDHDDKFAQRLHLVREWRERLAAARGTDDWVTVASACPTVGQGGVGKNWAGGPGRVKELKQQLKDLGADAAGRCEQYWAAALAIVVAEITRAVLDAARTRKRSGELEFHDLLVYARNILADDAVQRTLHEKYQRILLDEFQDTDPLQLEIAGRIVAGAEGRLFTVGDPKQSIYRFRRADIATYMAARDAQNPDAIVRLTTNFRSTRPVLDWVNTVFGRLITPERHIQPEHTPLDPAPGRPQWNTEWGPGPFVFASTPADSDARPAAEALRASEARDVARVIATALEKTWHKEVGGHGGFEHVPITLSDICILIPARTCLPFLEKALDHAGIEYRAEASSLVYSTQEIHDLLLTARALANLADEAALVAALRTPLFGCGDDDLLRWKTAGGRWLLHADTPDGLADSPIAEALTYLRNVWLDLAGMSPGQLLSRLATERRVFEVSTDSPRHRDVWRRLRFVIDQAHAWYSADGGDLRDYLAWAATQQDENARVTEAVLPEVGVNAVRIMTMHAAKGLQFPMVVLAGMSGGFRNTAEAALWDTDGQLHVHLSKNVKSPGFRTVSATETAHTRAERVRLLYVACTRAESFLAVSGYQPPRGEGWGTILAQGIDGMPNTTPELVDPTAPDTDAAIPEAAGVSWQQWSAETLTVTAASAVPSSISATHIVHDGSEVSASILADYRGRGLIPPATSVETVRAATDATESGTEVGIALHALLESVDLAAPLDAQFDVRAAAAARAAGLQDTTRFVAVARSALMSEPVRRAAVREHWREMPLAGTVPGVDVMVEGIADVVVEGIADLVYRDDDGSLVIVDYKTDLGVSTQTLDAYWAQLSVYADLLTRVADEQVSALVLVFLRTGETEVLERRFR